MEFRCVLFRPPGAYGVSMLASAYWATLFPRRLATRSCPAGPNGSDAAYWSRESHLVGLTTRPHGTSAPVFPQPHVAPPAAEPAQTPRRCSTAPGAPDNRV